jgi:hypothetical protein
MASSKGLMRLGGGVTPHMRTNKTLALETNSLLSFTNKIKAFDPLLLPID